MIAERGGERDLLLGGDARGGEIAKNYLARLVPEKGVRRDLADNGDLLVRRMGKAEVERRSLERALKAPSWLDSTSGGPRR